MFRILPNALLALASIAFAVAVMECGLRLRDYGSVARLSGEHVLRFPHPQRGWILLPGRTAFQRTRDYGVTVTINDKGLRNRPHEYAPAPGELARFLDREGLIPPGSRETRTPERPGRIDLSPQTDPGRLPGSIPMIVECVR